MSLWSINDIIKKNEDGRFLAICQDGSEYKATYCAKYRAMFFAIPSDKDILGYLKIIDSLQ